MMMSDDSSLMERLRADLASAYAIEHELKAGGMSRVFLAEDISLKRKVVIKVLAPRLAADISIERFAREVRFASGLQQANIVPVLSAGVAAGLPYYVMPFVDGESVRSMMKRGEVLSISDASSILKDIARALAYAHEHHVVHRDIKPENVLLSGGAAVVTDFGIAKALAVSGMAETPDTLTSVGESVGTPAYMSPEQASSDHIDVQSDVYSWGVMAYELLAGRHPFPGRSAAGFIRAHIAEIPDELSEVREEIPAPLNSVVMRALEKSPAARPASGRELYTLLSSTDSYQVRRRVPARFLAIAAVILIGVISIALSRRDTVKSIAVLPLVNIGGDPSQEYYSDGMSGEIADALASIPSVRLASRTSTLSLKKRADLDAREIADKLGVKYLVEGQLRRNGKRLLLSTQLTDGQSGQVVWQSRYDRNLEDVLVVQEDIARSIAKALKLNVPSAERLKAGTNSVAAYDLYMRGQAELEGFYSEASVKRAIAFFERAIATDPEYADPHVGLAWAWQNMADDFLPPSVTNPKVQALARKALSLDSLNAKAEISMIFGNWSLGRDFIFQHAGRGIDLAPNDAITAAFAGWSLAPFDWKVAKGWVDRGLDMDPSSETVRMFAAWSYVMNGDYHRGLKIAAAEEYANPSIPPNHNAAGEALLATDRDSAALRHFTLLADGLPDSGRSGMARALAALGKRDSALSLIRQLEQKSKTTYVSKDFIAAGYAALGMQNAAMDWLEQAERDKANYLKWLAKSPAWKPLAGNPRFEAMIRRLGLVG